MKRFISVTVGLLLGASAVTAFAQDYSRGRDEGNPAERQEQTQQREEQHQERQEQRQEPIQEFQAPTQVQEQPSQAPQGRGDGGRGQARQATEGFGVPVPGGYAQEQYQGRQGRGQRQDYSPSRGEVYGLAGQQNDGRYNRHGYRGDRGNWNHQDRGYRNDYGYGGHDRHWTGRYGWRNSWDHGWSGQRYHSPSRYYYPRGHSRLSWSIGFRLPSAFYGPSYYVDYRPYGLAAPPYGFRWIRADGDVLLVDLQTGEVVDVIYDFYY